jgi:release factor glutamine methyltransferase
MEPFAAIATCHELLIQAQAVLGTAGVATPRLDAEVLLADAMQVGRAALYARLREPVAPAVCENFAAAVERRARREPVAYITGVREFWSLPFLVTRDVLIPRPETELLVEVVCDLLRPSLSNSVAALPLHKVRRGEGRGEGSNSASPLVCDIGTGSGCIAVSLARELPHAHVVATDLSAAALEVARRNARAHGVESRITFVQSDLFVGIDPAARFDLIVSNPPYVAVDEDADAETEWEPTLALRAGAQGLDVVRDLLREAPSRLRADGCLVMEFGYGQAEALASLARSAGFGSVEIRPDLAGMARVLRAGKAMRSAER